RLRGMGRDSPGGAGGCDGARGELARARRARRMSSARELCRLHRARRRSAGSHSLLCRREPGAPDGCRRRGLAALVECVPNFSEGRQTDVITAIADAIRGTGARVIDVQADAAHNRMVVTFVAAPDLAVDAAFAGAAVATKRIDLRQHRGEHPRMGATDVVPCVPFADLPMSVCVELSRLFGSRPLTELRVLVYYYSEVADRDLVQVSMNLTDYRVTNIWKVFTVIRDEARRRGVDVDASEIVGTIPLAAAGGVIKDAVIEPAFRMDQILEKRVWAGE